MQRHSTADGPAIGYSLLRFSTPEQAKGDSYRRQTEGAKAWCEQNGITLDTSLWLFDPAVLGYTGEHRKNADRHALAAFLKLVQNGRIPRGSFLIVENLDRLTREDIQPALLLVLGLLQAGIRIVQLKPVAMVFDDKSDTLGVMMMIVELSRGHSESAMKSERVGAAWAEKKRRARSGEDQKPTERMGKGCVVVTRRLPAWVEEHDGKLHLIPERAAVVRLIFQLASNGYGYHAVAKKLTADGFQAFGSGKWLRKYISRILSDRRAIGEYQPRIRHKPEGPPIPGYFPPVVSEDEWWAAQAEQDKRHKRAANGKEIKELRQGKYVNIWAGLLKNARAKDDAYKAASRTNSRHRVIISSASTENGGSAYSFPLTVFEAAILAGLKEIDPHVILNGDSGPDESLALAAALAKGEAELAEATAFMETNGFSPTIGKRISEMEARNATLSAQLAKARIKAAHPLSETWGECQSLLSALNNAPDQQDSRLRLRAAIKRIIESVYLLVVEKGRDRLCLAQVWFNGGKKFRTYLIVYRANGNNRPGRWASLSIIHPDSGLPSNAEDLRKPDEAGWVLQWLESYHQHILNELLAKGQPLP